MTAMPRIWVAGMYGSQLALIYILILAYFDPDLLSFYEGHNRQSNEVAVMIPYTDSDPGEILQVLVLENGRMMPQLQLPHVIEYHHKMTI